MDPTIPCLSETRMGPIMRRTRAVVNGQSYRGEIQEINDQAWFVYTDRKGKTWRTRYYRES